MHTFTYNSDNPGTNTDISRIDTSPHSVDIIPNPTDRPISEWLRVVYYRASSTRGRSVPIPGSEVILYLQKVIDRPGNITEFSRVVTVPHGVETPTPLANIADWFELHGAASP